MNHAKLLRQQGDLEARRAEVSGLSSLYHDRREELASIRQHVSTRRLDHLAGYTSRTTLSELAQYSEADLAQCGVDLATCRRGAAVEAALADTRRRLDEAQAEVDPLARLVERLTAYAAGA